ncbi:hypothetical protein ACMFMG_001465 [Clarireedia jacksonii]
MALSYAASTAAPLTTSFPGASIQTGSGTTTSWLPLTTAWTANAACSTQVYAQENHAAILFDPFYQTVIDPGAASEPCLPPEATAWWNQATDSPISLGPTFSCPAAYSAVETIVRNTATQEILCCPSNFGLHVPMTDHVKGAFPTQCTSMMSSGDSYIYMTSTSGTWGPYTNKITGPYTVYAVHINGYNIQADPTSTSAAGPSEASTSQRSTPNSNSNSPAPIISGVKAAAIAFTSFVALGLLIFSSFLLHRHLRSKRKRQQTGNPSANYEIDEAKPASPSSSISPSMSPSSSRSPTPPPVPPPPPQPPSPPPPPRPIPRIQIHGIYDWNQIHNPFHPLPPPGEFYGPEVFRGELYGSGARRSTQRNTMVHEIGAGNGARDSWDERMKAWMRWKERELWMH